MVLRLFLLFFITNLAYADYILISAATGALGSEIAGKFAKEGHNLVLLGKEDDKLVKLKKEINNKYKVDIQTKVFDYTDLTSMQLKGLPKLSGAVIIPPRTIFKSKTIPEAGEWQVAVNEGFIGPLELIRNLTDNMTSNASVVIISGMTSKYYAPQYQNSNVIKMMWGGEVKNLCHQFAGTIRFNVVSPGVILTEFNQKKLAERAEKSRNKIAQQLSEETSMIPSRKYGTPEELNSLMYYLVVKSPAYLNCQNILLDGGVSSAY